MAGLFEVGPLMVGPLIVGPASEGGSVGSLMVLGLAIAAGMGDGVVSGTDGETDGGIDGGIDGGLDGTTDDGVRGAAGLFVKPLRLLFGRSDPFGIGVCGDRSVGTGATGTGATGAGVAIVGTSGSVGSEIGGGADNTLPGEDVPPGGKRVGGASLLGLGATILDASNFGGSATAATVPWPEAKAISPGGTESKEGKGSLWLQAKVP
ncbi:MAG: hypothetical protein ACKOAU_18380, partial [Pirellula sp.]